MALTSRTVRRRLVRRWPRRLAPAAPPILIEINGTAFDSQHAFWIMSGDSLTVQLQAVVTDLDGFRPGPKFVTLPITIRARVA